MARSTIIVIGGSAGAVEAAASMAAGLPAGIDAAVFVVVHFPETAISVLPRILERAGPLPAAHAEHGEPIVHGRIYVAPPGQHMLLNRGSVVLTRGAKENGHRPAIDPLFRTAARAYGDVVAGVVLSGNLDDGSAGLRRIESFGGTTIVQDPATALYRQMPDSALASVHADHVLSPADIGLLLGRLANAAEGEPDMSNDLNPRAGDDDYLTEQTAQEPNGRPSPFTCPECHGSLWEASDGDGVRFRCRVGHAYNPDSLLAEQDEALEAALWAALRALEEHLSLTNRMAARAEQRGNATSSMLFRERAADAEQRAGVIRRVLHGAPPAPPVAAAT
jgi:two-component system, chemotaxis family, protein-glutamate methylesterase/glutaminase